MTDKITAWLDEAQATADAATEGPWDYSPASNGNPADGPTHHEVRSSSETDQRAQYPIASTDYDEMGYRDAAFIADARTRLPQAIAALRAVLTEADRWQHTAVTEHIRSAVAAALGVQS